MRARVLPPEEWGKLSITGMVQIAPTLRPEDARTIVIEDGGRIVASMEGLRVTHLDSLWIDPEYRGNAGLGRRLMKAGIETARDWATDWIWATSGTDHMNDVLQRMGGKRMPVETFILPI